jgi:hypothetical protein
MAQRVMVKAFARPVHHLANAVQAHSKHRELGAVGGRVYSCDVTGKLWCAAKQVFRPAYKSTACDSARSAIRRSLKPMSPWVRIVAGGKSKRVSEKKKKRRTSLQTVWANLSRSRARGAPTRSAPMHLLHLTMLAVAQAHPTSSATGLTMTTFGNSAMHGRLPPRPLSSSHKMSCRNTPFKHHHPQS